jgi:hypothetical protein
LGSFVEDLKAYFRVDGFVELLQQQKEDCNPDLLRLIGMFTTPEFLAMIEELQANEYFKVKKISSRAITPQHNTHRCQYIALFLRACLSISCLRSSWTTEENAAWTFTKSSPRSAP